MRKSQLQLYAPFLVLALVQALFIAVAPSRGNDSAEVATFGGSGGGGIDPSTGEPVDGFDPETGDPVDIDTSTGGSSSSGGGSTGGGDISTGGDTGGGGAGGGAASAGDTSHCVDGRQHMVTRTGGPPCVPKFTGDNGGATNQGVTGDKIKVVYFSSEPNEQVDAILATQGLAVSEEENMAAVTAYIEFLHKHYEFYGREIELVRIVGNCPTTPPNYDDCIAAAQEVVKEKPFLVIWGTPLYASVFDVWAKNGIVSFGGWHFDDRFFTQRRPYRYDVFMDGTTSADVIAEYFCKKLAKGNASHAGSLIHATVGGRNTPRKLGIVVPEIEANVLTAQRVISQVKRCGGAVHGTPFTYESDIERAQEQTQATVEGLISANVTTVTCMCDPIAPAFLTKGMTQNTYFPEFLMPGLGLLDYDKLGRLYDQAQMEHAFGPSHLGLNIPLDDTDQARVWRDVGRSGHPCGDNGCGIQWAYVSLLGTAIQMAGPNLNPLTLEAGLLEATPESGGTPESPLANFGPGDYTALGDYKEVYWSNSARSNLDGQPGAFVPMNDGQRFRPGKLPTSFEIPVPSS